MRVIPPVAVDAGNLTSTTVAEPHASETTYSAVHIYKSGDRAISTVTHRVYESLSGTAAVVTITIASPGVVTWANHGFAAGTPIAFATTGTLPTGLTAGVTYYVLNPALNTFQLAATAGGSAINTSVGQSGVHTATANPNIGRALDDTTWWGDAGPTLKWAMFDLYRNTASIDASPLVVEITPGRRVDSIGLVGLDAEEVTIEIEAGSPPAVVYSRTEALITREVAGWYDYFFAPFRLKTAIALFDLPPYSSGTVRVTLTGASDVSCGGVALGLSEYVGETEHGAESDATNFSTIDRNEISGDVTLVPRRSVPKSNQTVITPKANVSRLQRLRNDLNAVPALWSGLDDENDHAYFDPLLILGVYRRFLITLSEHEEAQVSLELEEI